MLLFEEVHLVDVCVLGLAEVVLEVGDVTAHLLEQLIEIFSHLVLQGGALTPQDLGVPLVLL